MKTKTKRTMARKTEIVAKLTVTTIIAMTIIIALSTAIFLKGAGIGFVMFTISDNNVFAQESGMSSEEADKVYLQGQQARQALYNSDDWFTRTFSTNSWMQAAVLVGTLLIIAACCYLIHQCYKLIKEMAMQVAEYEKLKKKGTR